MRRIVLPLLLVALLGAGAMFAFRNSSAAVAPLAPTALPEPAAPLVVADATVLPAFDITLSFERAGTVAEVLVTEGASVTAGQALARLDSRALELQIQQARVGLERAEARYNQIAAGASPEALAAAEAGLSTARAQQAQAAAGVTTPDLRAAQAQLAEAEAALAELLDGADNTAITQAQAALDQAQANFGQQRDGLSASKTGAELAVQQAANALRDAQDAYSRIYWDNRELDDQVDDLPQERIDAEAAAERAVENAEAALAQAQVAYDQARQAEVEGLAAAEARTRDAQARLDQVVAAPDNDRVAAAQARVAAAEAALARLRGPNRASTLEVAAAGVAQAEAARAQVAAPAREVDLAAALVEIEAAQVALKQAELELELATLKAPVAGTVARLDLEVGGLAGPSVPALVLADLSQWKIETDDLSELQVVHIREGDLLTVQFDALPDLGLPGRVTQIKPIGSNRQGEIVYTVVVALEQSDPRLRWNMTAIISAER